MSEQDNGRVAIVQRPSTDNKEDWAAYWKQQGQSWRTEPEIDLKRQKYLAERRAITPDIKKGIYPFRGIRLYRADIEWLLASHDNGRGPVDWNDEEQRGREGLDLRGADLQQIDLQGLPLARIRCSLTKDEQPPAREMQCIMARAQMQKAVLADAQLQGAHLHHVHLDEALLMKAQLEEADLTEARLEGANLSGGQLQRADLSRAKLQEGSLYEAQLQGTIFRSARLERVDFRGALLEEADLRDAVLLGAFLQEVNFCGKGYVSPLFADVEWSNAKIDGLDWSEVKVLGDEFEARQKKDNRGKIKGKQKRLSEYKCAVRANRQLAVVLRNQGLNEDAARFAYHAQLMQHKVFWYERKYGQYLFSLFLALLAGYGYKPLRSFIAYLIVIATFAGTYFIIGRTAGPALSPLGSVVFSMTSFHGRGFFPGGIRLDDSLTVLAAIEAFVGLLIEVTFIATLTQRLFGK